MQDLKLLDKSQYEQVFSLTREIIENMPEDALSQLTSGTEKDLDRLLNTIVQTTYETTFAPAVKLNNYSYGYLDRLIDGVDEILKRESLSYFTSNMMPDFEMNFHHVEWGSFASLYKYLSIIAARDHSKSFFWSKAYPIWQMYRYEKPSLIKRVHPKFSILKQGMIITAEKSLATFLLSLIKDEIENNPLLREALYPGLSEGWSATGIVCKNGAGMTAKSYGTKKRGFHPGWIVVDDFQTDQVMYSKEQREKYIDHFMSVIMNMIVPNGQVINVGTPYHQQDLFSVLKKSKAWKVFEYPAILPDGRVLWSNRYTLEHILEKRYSQGNLVFSREFLCRPISSESTIFPWSILQRSFMGMDKYTLVDNIHSHPLAKQFSMVVVGCDFAISSNVGADSSVFTVWGVDERDRYWLLYCWVGKGVKYGEQIARLKWINTNFRPTVFGMESNQMQMIFAQESDAQGLPVKACNTGTNKHDLIKGLPGLAILFEQGRILMPRGDQRSKDISDEACLQFSNIAFTDKGLESVGEHDDYPMSFWTGLKIAQEAGVGFNFSWM